MNARLEKIEKCCLLEHWYVCMSKQKEREVASHIKEVSLSGTAFPKISGRGVSQTDLVSEGSGDWLFP